MDALPASSHVEVQLELPAMVPRTCADAALPAISVLVGSRCLPLLIDVCRNRDGTDGCTLAHVSIVALAR
jgi:hypothetical protein